MEKKISEFNDDVQEMIKYLKSGGSIFFFIPKEKKKFFRKQTLRFLKFERLSSKYGYFSLIYGVYLYVNYLLGTNYNSEMKQGLDLYTFGYASIKGIDGENCDGMVKVIFVGEKNCNAPFD